MMLEVNIESYKDLTEYEADGASNNGAGKEYAAYLRVRHGGKTIALESDAMESEDCTFKRGLSWVSDLLKIVYDLGYNDGMEI